MTSLPILLPDGFSPLVSVGDTVSSKQPIAEKQSSGNTAVINVAEELGVPVEKAGKLVKKNPGDTIEPGDIIAARNGLLGLGQQKVLSSVSGKIVSYERRTGDMAIQIGEENSSAESETILSPIDGKVTVCDNEQIVIETEKNALIPRIGLGKSKQAVLLSLPADEDTAVPLHVLTPDVIDKVIAVPMLNRDGLVKAVGMGVSGIVVSSLDEKDEKYLVDKAIDTPLLVVDSDDLVKIQKWSGKQVYLDGEKKSIVLLQT